MNNILERIREVRSLKIRKNMLRLSIAIIGVLIGALTLVFHLEIINFLIEKFSIDIGITVTVLLGFLLAIFFVIQIVILIFNFFSEGYSFKEKIRNINVNEKRKIEEIENKLKKDKSPVIITKDCLVIFNNDIIYLEEISDINFKVYTKRSSIKDYREVGGVRVRSGNIIEYIAARILLFIIYKIYTFPHKVIALDVEFKRKINREVTIDICRARYIDEFDKREIENKVEKLKEVIKRSEVS